MEAVNEDTFSKNERRNKITRDIKDVKYTCKSCCITMNANSYYKHIQSKTHKEGSDNSNVLAGCPYGGCAIIWQSTLLLSVCPL